MGLREISYQRQVEVPVVYKGVVLNSHFRMDLIVRDKVIVELKSVDHVEEIHMAQCLTYLKLSSKKLCLLLNFNVISLREGIKRIVWNL